MIVHNIIDISPLYHRFAYSTRGKGASDIPVMYLVLREVERLREQAEVRGADVVTSACFDSKGSLRKQFIHSEESEVYKSGRQSILTEQDFIDIETMKQILSDAGVNVYCKEGCEADDLMAFLAKYYYNDFELSVLYSTDKDIMANITGTIGMRRFTGGNWVSISESNFAEEASNSFKTLMPHNAIGLYLCTVGDSADKIPGISKFGPKAFEKLVLALDGKVDWSALTNYDNVAKVLVWCCDNGYLTGAQFEQAVESYNMVRNIEIVPNKDFENIVNTDDYGFKKIMTGIQVPSVLKTETVESRIAAYTNAGMPSLAK